jgi:hypothetical protein
MRRIAAAGLLIAAILAASPSDAAMSKDAREDFVQACEAQMYMPAPACRCMADIAEQNLDDTAIAYLSLDANDVVHSAAMSKTMTAAEIASIDNFMKTAPGQCKDAK